MYKLLYLLIYIDIHKSISYIYICELCTHIFLYMHIQKQLYILITNILYLYHQCPPLPLLSPGFREPRARSGEEGSTKLREGCDAGIVQDLLAHPDRQARRCPKFPPYVLQIKYLFIYLSIHPSIYIYNIYIYTNTHIYTHMHMHYEYILEVVW